MPYSPGGLADEELGGGQGAGGVAVAVGGADGQLDRLAQHAEDDRVLARIVADADGVIADFVVRAFAGPAFAAVAMRGLAHHAGDDLAELQGRAAGRVFLEAVMPFEDFHVGVAVLQRRGRPPRPVSSSDSPPGSCWATRAAGSARAAARSFCDLRLAQAGGGHDQRNLLLAADFDDRLGGGGHGEIDHHVDRHVEAGRERHAERLDAGDQSGVFAQRGWSGASSAATSDSS